MDDSSLTGEIDCPGLLASLISTMELASPSFLDRLVAILLSTIWLTSSTIPSNHFLEKAHLRSVFYLLAQLIFDSRSVLV